MNAARAQAGVAPLTMDARLVSTARAHNARMISGCGLAHQCPGESGLGRLWAAGVTDRAIGENIGYRGPAAATTAQVTDAAKRITAAMLAEKPPADGHRVNILNPGFQHVGIAIVRDAKGLVWLTQDFSGTASPKS